MYLYHVHAKLQLYGSINISPLKTKNSQFYLILRLVYSTYFILRGNCRFNKRGLQFLLAVGIVKQR